MGSQGNGCLHTGCPKVLSVTIDCDPEFWVFVQGGELNDTKSHWHPEPSFLTINVESSDSTFYWEEPSFVEMQQKGSSRTQTRTVIEVWDATALGRAAHMVPKIYGLDGCLGALGSNNVRVLLILVLPLNFSLLDFRSWFLIGTEWTICTQNSACCISFRFYKNIVSREDFPSVPWLSPPTSPQN